MNWSQNFWKGLLRESDGTPSTSRLGSLVTLIAALVWISYLVFKTHAVPDVSGFEHFVVGVVASLYGVNKVSTTIGQVFGQK